MQSNKKLWERTPFGLPYPTNARFTDGYQVRLIILEGTPLVKEGRDALRELFNMDLYEQLPNLFSNPKLAEAVSFVLDHSKREDLLDALLTDAAAVMFMTCPTGAPIGYMVVSTQNRILGMYIIPAFRRDRIATGMLECYINRFDIKELTAGTVIGDKNAETFLNRLGFVQQNRAMDDTNVEWLWTYPEQK